MYYRIKIKILNWECVKCFFDVSVIKEEINNIVLIKKVINIGKLKKKNEFLK